MAVWRNSGRAGRRGPLILAVAALLLLGLLLPRGASAAVMCRYNATTRVLSVTATGEVVNATGGADFAATILRVGTGISVSVPEARVDCHGSPSVTNTDHIKAIARGLGSVDINLSGGPFAPGATLEPDTSSEIEFTVGGDSIVRVVGGPRADHFRYTTAPGGDGLNLNPGPDDQDVDVIAPNPESEPETSFIAEGGPGPDTIDVVGRPKVDVFADGGSGNDTLSARGARFFGPILVGKILIGGSGRDRIIGSPSFDLISPGSGADLVKAKGGSDEIDMRPDKSRDRIDCDNGHDKVVKPDPFDRLRSCERVKHGRRH